MIILSQSSTDEEVKEVIRRWVALLGDGDYHGAVDMLWPEIPHEDYGITTWTPALLRDLIRYYGLTEPLEGDDYEYDVIPLTVELLDAFERHLSIEHWPYHDTHNLWGGVYVDLPLNLRESTGISDLTARFDLKPINANQMVLVLEDVHVL